MAWGERTVGLVREDLRLMQKAVDDSATRPESAVDALAVASGNRKIERLKVELAELTEALPNAAQMSVLHPMWLKDEPRMIGDLMAKPMLEAGWIKATDQPGVFVIEEKGCTLAKEMFVRDTPVGFHMKSAKPAPAP